MDVAQANQARGLRHWAVSLGFLLVALACAGQAKAAEWDRKELDRVVATVNGAPLTLSELIFEAKVALIQRGGAAAASALSDGAAVLDTAALRAALDYAIGQRLQAAEAEKLSAFQLEDEEVSAAVKRFMEKLGGKSELEAFLRLHEMDLSALSALLGRELRAEKLLDSKLRLRAQVSESDVRRYYELHAKELPGTYEQQKGLLKVRLSRERYQQLAVEELTSLRRGADVRIIGPLAKP